MEKALYLMQKTSASFFLLSSFRQQSWENEGRRMFPKPLPNMLKANLDESPGGFTLCHVCHRDAFALIYLPVENWSITIM